MQRLGSWLSAAIALVVLLTQIATLYRRQGAATRRMEFADSYTGTNWSSCVRGASTAYLRAGRTILRTRRRLQLPVRWLLTHEYECEPGRQRLKQDTAPKTGDQAKIDNGYTEHGPILSHWCQARR